MIWFEGSIAAAISEAKQRRVLFVVYIHGDNDESKKMTETWDDTVIANMCEETKLIAMRFEANSEECKQFSQFYPVLCVPSVSLISGETGVLLEGVAGYLSPEDFAAKVRSVSETLKQSLVNKPASSPPPAAPASGSSTSTSVPKATVTGTPGGGGAAPAAQAKENVQERAKRLREKMETIHKQKEAQKDAEIRRKEMDRRKMGQNVQKQQQLRDNKEAIRSAEELRKKKAEDKIAKDRVRAQIAQDREDKKARFDTERTERERLQASKETAQLLEKSEEQKVKATVNMEVARLQFRLPDGSTVTNQFPSSSPLQEAHDFLAQHVGDALKEFTLSTTFPRRRFAASDLSRSLLDLELAPSSAIIVLPGRYKPSSSTKTVASSDGGGGSFFMWILAPLLFIWNAFYNFLFGSASSSSSSDSSNASQQDASPSQSTTYSQQSSSQGAASPTGARPKSSYARRRNTGKEAGSSYKKDSNTNIHRLVGNSDEDDDSNTWNGNSTQQM